MNVVIFCGVQASGKSTFYQQQFFHTHIRINLDMLRTRHREWILYAACIEAKQPVVIDNTNPTVADRAKYIDLARRAGFRVMGYYFHTAIPDALERNAGRTGKARVPDIAIYGTNKRLLVPTHAEGFDKLYQVDLVGREFAIQEMMPT